MFEIDLHHMNFETALRIFIQKYNHYYKGGGREEICVIHGYGAGFLDSNPVIKVKLRQYLSKNKENLKYRLDMNPGVTYITPLNALSLPKKKKRGRI